MPVERILLAEPRGFCAGVEKAIKALGWMVRTFEPPVYCYHEIVHNRHVVDEFRALGVVFVDDVDEVPEGAPLMLSAHGTAPEIASAAHDRGRVVVDAVCPLVTKVHHEMKVRARKGYTVLYVGHHGHEEAAGTMAVAPESVRLVETVDDVDALADREADAPPMALLAQTTLSHDEWAGIVDRARERFPELWMPNRSDLCFATTNRQAALKAIAGKADAVVVIGSPNSSNTIALEKVAIAFGCPAGGAGQRCLRGADRPVRDGRCDRGRIGSGVPGPSGGGSTGPRVRGGGHAGHGGGGVLPSPARAPGPPEGPGRHGLVPGRLPGVRHRPDPLRGSNDGRGRRPAGPRGLRSFGPHRP